MEPLGSGAAGRVFKVEHAITRRVEAMKVLLHGRPDQQEMAQRFLREIQVQARLDHPNIASVLNAMWVDEDLVMVMEMVDGEPLAQKLERGPVPLREALGLVKQTLDALEYAHARGVVHRDISTANIIVTPDGTVKLTDFGLARMENDTRLTQTGVAVGSLHYMSPEQVKATDEPDARSDIYSVGAVLYELAAGRKAFEGGTVFALMVAQVQQRPAPPSQLNPSVPQALGDAILKALNKDPADRFQSAAEFRAALEKVKLPEHAPVDTAPAPAAAAAPPRLARRRIYAAGVAVTILGAGIGLITRLLPERPAPPPPVRASIPPPPLETARSAAVSSQPAPRDSAVTLPGAETPPHGAQPKPPAAAPGRPQAAAKPETARKIELPAAPDPPKVEPPAGPGFRQSHEMPIGTSSRVIAFSPDGRLLAVASERNTVDVWDTGANRKQASLEGHSEVITSLAFSPDGRSLASGSRDGTVRVWDLAARQQRQSLAINDPVRTLAFSPDSRFLATGSKERKINVWNLGERGSSRELKERMKEPQALAFSPDGRTLISASGEKTVRVWSLLEDKVQTRLSAAENAALLAVSPDGNLLATAGGGAVRIVDTASGQDVQSMALAGRVEALTFTRAGQCLAAVSSPGSVDLWNVSRGVQVGSAPRDRYVQSVALSASGRRLAMVKDGGTAAILEGNPAGGPIVPDSLPPAQPQQKSLQKEGFRLRNLFRRGSR